MPQKILGAAFGNKTVTKSFDSFILLSMCIASMSYNAQKFSESYW